MRKFKYVVPLWLVPRPPACKAVVKTVGLCRRSSIWVILVIVAVIRPASDAAAKLMSYLLWGNQCFNCFTNDLFQELIMIMNNNFPSVGSMTFNLISFNLKTIGLLLLWNGKSGCTEKVPQIYEAVHVFCRTCQKCSEATSGGCTCTAGSHSCGWHRWSSCFAQCHCGKCSHHFSLYPVTRQVIRLDDEGSVFAAE